METPNKGGAVDIEISDLLNELFPMKVSGMIRSQFHTMCLFVVDSVLVAALIWTFVCGLILYVYNPNMLSLTSRNVMVCTLHSSSFCVFQPYNQPNNIVIPAAIN